jgi:hypothetical protein
MKILFILLSAGLLLAAGCSKQSAPAKEKGRQDSHAHHAPNGGTLVELGDHQFNLELVFEPAAGTLTGHVLNGHADNIVRLDARELPVILLVDGAERRLILLPVENRLSNETVGDTSVFSAQADWLRASTTLEGYIPAITVRGLRFESVRFRLTGPTPPR